MTSGNKISQIFCHQTKQPGLFTMVKKKHELLESERVKMQKSAILSPDMQKYVTNDLDILDLCENITHPPLILFVLPV